MSGSRRRENETGESGALPRPIPRLLGSMGAGRHRHPGLRHQLQPVKPPLLLFQLQVTPLPRPDLLVPVK